MTGTRHLTRCALLMLFAGSAILLSSGRASAVEPIPEKIVVLTFDDSVRSHYTVVRPLLKKYKFGATFFITEGFDFRSNKKDYMTWEQIAELHRDGFEIGNHTRDHLAINDRTAKRVTEQVEAINKQCQKHGIPRTVSFAWPGNAFAEAAFAGLKKAGIRWARRGGAPEYPYKAGKGIAYQPGFDHPLLIPTAGDARPHWELGDLVAAVRQARPGKIAVLQFHGVPDRAHPWVNTPVEKFELFLRYLAKEKYRVIALRDVARYADPTIEPHDPRMIIRDRQAQLKAGGLLDNARRPANDAELRYWLTNMVRLHGYTPAEAARGMGMTVAETRAAIARVQLKPRPATAPRRDDRGRLLIAPYPGGRHPRIGFLDGAIRPQRETKFSAFAPWKDGGYVVADIPEAIWHDTPKGRKLLYLAHTHVPTVWSEQGKTLERREWKRLAEGGLEVERTLPNGVRFGARIRPRKEGVRMSMWLHNGSDRKLTGLRVQNCVMLKAAPEFNARLNENRNKRFQAPYAACRNAAGDRWVITAWTHCQRPWGNVDCPCLHADPQFPDCEPGQTGRLQGWLSFYEGRDLAAELKRLDTLGWQAEDAD